MPKSFAFLRFTVEQREQIARELPSDFYRFHDDAKLATLETLARKAGISIPQQYVGLITSQAQAKAIDLDNDRRHYLLSVLWAIFVKGSDEVVAS